MCTVSYTHLDVYKRQLRMLCNMMEYTELTLKVLMGQYQMSPFQDMRDTPAHPCHEIRTPAVNVVKEFSGIMEYLLPP